MTYSKSTFYVRTRGLDRRLCIDFRYYGAEQTQLTTAFGIPTFEGAPPGAQGQGVPKYRVQDFPTKFAREPRSGDA